MSLQAIKFDRDNLTCSILDQLLLPYTSKYIPVHTIDDGFSVIKKMQVRGAPAIAIVGAIAVLLELNVVLHGNFTQVTYDISNVDQFRDTLRQRLDFLLGSRPTAVNLSNALKEIHEIVNKASSTDDIFQGVQSFVITLIDEDYANNVRMGDNGRDFILKELQEEGFHGDFSVLNICNTGSLATSGYGTALGVIRSLWADSQKKVAATHEAKKAPSSKMTHVYPCETRPYNQGGRLTSYELVYEKIPSTLITDNMVAYRITTLLNGDAPVKACLVGADRIARNGDTANKIGTFQLSLLCRHYGIKFCVVAPKTTVDLNTSSGDDIFVELRKPEELCHVTGAKIDDDGNVVLGDNGEPLITKVGVVAPGMNVWNPSFDVTPHEYIDAIITEEGVLTKNADGEFDLSSLK